MVTFDYPATSHIIGVGSYDHKGLFQQHKSWGESGIFGCNLMLHITLVTLQECHCVSFLLQGWMQGTNINIGLYILHTNRKQVV